MKLIYKLKQHTRELYANSRYGRRRALEDAYWTRKVERDMERIDNEVYLAVWGKERSYE
tara:strand:+ start:418 stop:594 length:177 start_codon:yes stop_codon:yes gene_type:complete